MAKAAATPRKKTSAPAVETHTPQSAVSASGAEQSAPQATPEAAATNTPPEEGASPVTEMVTGVESTTVDPVGAGVQVDGLGMDPVEVGCLCTVLEPLRRNGQRYAPGAGLSLPASVAQRLAAQGVVRIDEAE